MSLPKYDAGDANFHNEFVNFAWLQQFWMFVLTWRRQPSAYRTGVMKAATDDPLEHVDRLSLGIHIKDLHRPIGVGRGCTGVNVRLRRPCDLEVLTERVRGI